MMHWTIILLFATHLMTVHSQTWIGIYIINSTCGVGSCCCMSNSIALSSSSSNMLAFNTSLTGSLCQGQTSYAGQVTYPTGYTITVTISIITLNMVLSNDSSILTVTSSLGSSCGAEAFRESPIVQTTSTTTTVHSNAAVAEQYVNILILFSLAFLSVVLIF